MTTNIYDAQIISIFFSFIFLFILIYFALEFVKKRKTKVYREEISDMYVSAKIREIAESEKIDLEKEYNNFKRWNKARKIESQPYSYDNVVEDDLKEKVSDKLNKDKKGTK